MRLSIHFFLFLHQAKKLRKNNQKCILKLKNGV